MNRKSLKQHYANMNNLHDETLKLDYEHALDCWKFWENRCEKLENKINKIVPNENVSTETKLEILHAMLANLPRGEKNE